MNHITEDELVLFFYGETEAPQARNLENHLTACRECRDEFERLRSQLSGVEMPVSEPAPDYENDVWLRIRPQLPVQTRSTWFGWFASPKWVAAAAMAVVILGAFSVGRWFERNFEISRRHTAAPSAPVTSAGSYPVSARERALLISVGMHLDRTQILLAELANAKPSNRVDISAAGDSARLLLPDNRLYRETALQLSDVQIANLLDELERLLLDLSHRPSTLSNPEFHDLRDRIEEDGVLFKVRIVGSELKNRL